MAAQTLSHAFCLVPDKFQVQSAHLTVTQDTTVRAMSASNNGEHVQLQSNRVEDNNLKQSIRKEIECFQTAL